MILNLGDMLIKSGLLTDEQIEQALEEQKKNKDRLDTNLVKLGFITEEKITEFLGKQYGVPTVDLKNYTLDPNVLNLISPEVAVKYEVIPLAKYGKTLTIAIANPTNVSALDDIKFLTGFAVKPTVCAASAIRKAIDSHYGSSDLQDKVMEGLKGAELEIIKDKDADTEDEADIIVAADAVPVVKLVNTIISDAVSKRASDIHIEPYEKELRIRYRIDGVLHDVMRPPYRLKGAITSRIKIIGKMKVEEKRRPQDGRIKLKVKDRLIDLRVSTVPTLYGEKVALRILDRTAVSFDLDKIGFDEDSLTNYMQAIKNPNGIILVTGPTGCGKTTTLYATLNEINDPRKNISTAEEPVEFGMMGINQVNVKEDVGLTFASSLRSFLRQDPDVIMVGEIRDKETAEIAVRASLTGHLVLSTVHTNTAAATITRLINMGVEPFLIASTIVAVASQRLVRSVCEGCKEHSKPEVDEFIRAGIDPEEFANVTIYKGKGCSLCDNTGYKGRIALFEVLPVTGGIRSLILERAITGRIEEEAVKEGMLTLRKAGLLKLKSGLTTLEEVMKETMEE